MSLTEKYNYCAFVDVLGYGNIVTSPDYSTGKKIKMLESIYMNSFSTSSWTVKQINLKFPDKIFIKSFSDCIYLESDDEGAIICALYNFFNKALGYYINIQEGEYTHLLRAGMVYDWTLRIMDIGSLSRHPIQDMPHNDDYKNIIGLGVARSFYTSEKSNLSGMRIIISSEVAALLNYQSYDLVPFECYTFEITNFLHDPQLSNSPEKIKLFLLPIREDEKGQLTTLFELCWPVFKYEFRHYNSDINILIESLIRIEHNFNSENVRHLKKTAQLMYKAFQITLAEHEKEYEADFVERANHELLRLSGQNLTK